MKTLLLLTILLCANFGISQTLKTDNLDLNSGGVIYDVVFDEYSNAFIVVGDFTTIQGVARQNLAMIDATTFTVQTETPITSINGAIRTVALKRDFLFPLPNRNYLYIGGDFTQVNGVTRNYICQLQKQEPTSPPFNSNYNLMALWDAGVFNSFNPNHHVNDFVLNGDTLVGVGAFEIYAGLPLWATYDYGGIISCKANSNTFDTIGSNTQFQSFASTNLNAEHFAIDFFNDHYFLAGDLGFQRFDNNGVLINDFQDCNTNASYAFEIHVSNQDTLVFSRVQFSGNEGIAVHQLDGTLVNCPITSPQPIILQNGGSPADGYATTYNNQVFTAESDALLSYTRDELTPMQPEQTITINNNWYSFLGAGWRPQKFKVVEDKLFILGENLTTIDGQSHNGLAALCLPPHDAEDFTASDTLVCEEELVVYTIPDAEFATGYKWTYSGSGAQYRIAGTGSALQPLLTNFVDNSNGNSLEVFYPIGSTGGLLYVEPYSTCNSPTDYMLSLGQSLNVQVVELPNASMPDTTYFNCFSDSSWMVVSSSTIGVSSYIYKGMDTTFNDSMLFEINSLPSQLLTESYIGVVVEPINQCTSVDTSVFKIDTVGIDISGSFGSSPSYFYCNTASATINCTAQNASIYWEYENDPSVPLPNPFNIYSLDSIDFIVYVTDTANGCLSIGNMTVQVDTAITLGSIVGYGGVTFPLDSISCNDPTLSMTCQAVDGTAEWLVNGMPTGNDVINLTEADTVGSVSGIGIFQYQTVDSNTGCAQVFEVAIAFDFDKPFVVDHQGNPSINCSDAVAEVIHLSSGNPIEGWLDPFGVQTMSDTLLASSTGEYYYQVQGSNGCLNTDTVNVSQTLDMSVTMPIDTLICPDETVSILAVPTINTGETPTFLWSDGSTGNIANAIGGIDSELSVIVQTSSGCIGYDTTDILITAPISAYFTSSAGCSSGAIQVDSISGGSGNYEYSLDQINWQSTAAFTDVNVGIITVFVRDDLGCVYDFQQTIDPAAIGLDVNFLVPTYNDLGDTLVAVSFESFLGFDSLNWVIPNGAITAFEADSIIAFTMNTEGWYDITLIGYSDTCQYSTTHQVYFGASVQFDSITNNLGVQSILVYPNPTTGNFTVDVELGEIQNYTIQIVSSSGQPLQGMSVSGVGKIISESFQFPLGTVSGSYILHFICDYDIEQETIILN